MKDYLTDTAKFEGSFAHLEADDTLLFVAPDPDYCNFKCGIKAPRILYEDDGRAYVEYTKEDLLYTVLDRDRAVFVTYEDSLEWVNAVLHKDPELEKEEQETFDFDGQVLTLAQMCEMQRLLCSAIERTPGSKKEDWIGWRVLVPLFPSKNFACDVAVKRRVNCEDPDICSHCPCTFKGEKPCLNCNEVAT